MSEPLRPLSDGLEEILNRLGVPAVFDQAALVEEWSEIAGDTFGRMSRPAGLEDGELVVVVSDGTTATLLRYRVGELLDRLADRFGPGSVTSVRIAVEGPKNRP